MIGRGPFVDKPSDSMMEEIHDAEAAILEALSGVDPSVKAQACLFVAVAIWQLGGATADQARKVALAAIDAIMTERSN